MFEWAASHIHCPKGPGFNSNFLPFFFFCVEININFLCHTTVSFAAYSANKGEELYFFFQCRSGVDFLSGVTFLVAFCPVICVNKSDIILGHVKELHGSRDAHL